MPSVDAILRSAAAEKIAKETGAKHLTKMARTVSDALRREIMEKAVDGTIGGVDYSRENLLKESERKLEQAWIDEQSTRLQRVITYGVIIQQI